MLKYLLLFILIIGNKYAYAGCGFNSEEVRYLNIYNYTILQSYSVGQNISKLNYGKSDIENNFLKRISSKTSNICQIDYRSYLFESNNKEIGVISIKFEKLADRDIFLREMEKSRGRINNKIMISFEVDVIDKSVYIYYGTYNFLKTNIQHKNAKMVVN